MVADIADDLAVVNEILPTSTQTDVAGCERSASDRLANGVLGHIEPKRDSRHVERYVHSFSFLVDRRRRLRQLWCRGLAWWKAYRTDRAAHILPSPVDREGVSNP
jgi:hypothetical protein